VLDATPFYGESGGQVGDAGAIASAGGASFEVADAERAGEIVLHRGRVVKGELATGEAVTATVDLARRLDVARNHTATHLLHHELRARLGPHVHQAGSLVEPGRLRLDFSHGEAVSRADLDAIEAAVNERVMADEPVATELTTVEAARAKGAMALFGEKYGASVRLVTVGDFSRELCGGTHLRRSGEIGLFRIVGEESVAAGVRRITAVTGRAACESVKADERVIAGLVRELKAPPAELLSRVESLAERARSLERELRDAKRKALSGGGAGDLMSKAVEVSGVKVLAADLGEARADDVRAAGDVLRPMLGKSAPEGYVLVLAGAKDGKVAIAAWVAPEGLRERGVRAGDVVKAISPVVGGGGGGRPDSAQAGGRDPTKVAEALAMVEGLVRAALKCSSFPARPDDARADASPERDVSAAG
jgi:alanyl-tRNA synthetase